MKRISSLLLSIAILLLCAFPVVAESPREEQGTFYYEVSDKLYASPPSKALDNIGIKSDELAASIAEQIASCPETIDISAFKIPANNENAARVIELVKYYIPECFNSNFDPVGVSGTSTYLTEITNFNYLSFADTPQEYEEAWEDINEAATALTGDIAANNSLSDAEKALLIHDRLAVRNEYDTTMLLEPSHSMYGALVSRTSVCDGYTKAYIYLLDLVGIEAEYCVSETLNHAWNIVYIDGTPYHVDVTWDDPLPDVTGQVNHDYFLISSDKIRSQRIIDQPETPNATDFNMTPSDETYDDYIWRDNIQAAVQLVGNDIYCVNKAFKLEKLNADAGTITVLRDLQSEGKWTTGTNAWYGVAFTRLASDGNNLFYTTPSSVCKYDIANDTSTVIFTPEQDGDYYWIYGMGYENGLFTCDTGNTFDENFDKTAHSKTFDYYDCSVSGHDLITTVNPATTDADGSIVQQCRRCDYNTTTDLFKASDISVSAGSFTYNSKTQKPTITVKDSNGNTISATNYTLVWSDNSSVSPGTYTVDVNFKKNYSGSVSFTYKILPRQITGLKASTVTGASVKLSWTKLPEASYYRVMQSTDGTTWKTAAVVAANSTTIKNLTAGTKYQFKIIALDESKTIAGKASAILKTGTKTAAPTISSLKSSKALQATVTWNKVTGASSYNVYNSYDNKTWTLVKSGLTSNSCTLTGLKAGKKVYVKVAGVNAYDVCGSFSAVKNVSVTPVASKVTASGTTFNYNGKTRKPTISVTDSNGKALAKTLYSITWSDSNSKNVGTYTVKVTLKGNYAATKTLSYKIRPRQVTGLKASTVTANSIKLTWTKLSEASYYRVLKSDDGKTWTAATVVSGNTATVKNLTAGSRYQFKVVALDSTKKIGGAASAILKTGTKTAAPKITYINSFDPCEAFIEWDTVKGASSYTVYKSTDNKNWTKVKSGITDPLSYNVTGLPGGATVYLKVTAVNAYKVESSASAVKSVTTLHYVLNTRSGIYHVCDCSYVYSMSDKNRLDVSWSKAQCESNGYRACSRCG